MKVRKNLEAVFLVASIVATATSYATASVPTYHPAKNAQLSAAMADAKMHVVTVSHKRLTAAEKAKLD